jgi:hypothetical protein
VRYEGREGSRERERSLLTGGKESRWIGLEEDAKRGMYETEGCVFRKLNLR